MGKNNNVSGISDTGKINDFLFSWGFSKIKI